MPHSPESHVTNPLDSSSAVSPNEAAQRGHLIFRPSGSGNDTGRVNDLGLRGDTSSRDGIIDPWEPRVPAWDKQQTAFQINHDIPVTQDKRKATCQETGIKMKQPSLLSNAMIAKPQLYSHVSLTV
jgi:hypothetical protein